MVASIAASFGGKELPADSNEDEPEPKEPPDTKTDTTKDPDVEKHGRSLACLETDAGKMLRLMGDELTQMKTMFLESEGKRFCGEIHVACENLVPKLASVYTAIQDVVVQKVKDPSVLLAVAKKIDEVHAEYDDVYGEFNKMIGGPMKKPRRR